MHTLHDKLDASTSKEWELYLNSETPKLSTLLKFIDWQAKALSIVQFSENRESRDNRKRIAPKSEHKHEKRMKYEHEQSSSSTKKSEQKTCVVCNENHAVHRCSKFLKSNLMARRKIVREHSLCNNCLRASHYVKDCMARACLRCNVKHNSLLCPENPNLQGTANVVQKVPSVKRKAAEQKKEREK